MIKKVSVLITFPLGASFVGNVNVDVYRSITRFIHHLMCFNTLSKCRDCTKKEQCRYYQLTGNNFTDYPGILIHSDLFDKKHYKKGEQKEFHFYFVGNNVAYVDYVELFFEQLHQSLFHNPFYFNSVNATDLDNKQLEKIKCRCMTPIEKESVSDSYNQMVSFYNASYQTDFKSIDECNLTNVRNILWDPINLKTRRIEVKGYIGNIYLNHVNSSLLEIGIGKYNFIGGGQIAVED